MSQQVFWKKVSLRKQCPPASEASAFWKTCGCMWSKHGWWFSQDLSHRFCDLDIGMVLSKGPPHPWPRCCQSRWGLELDARCISCVTLCANAPHQFWPWHPNLQHDDWEWHSCHQVQLPQNIAKTVPVWQPPTRMSSTNSYVKYSPTSPVFHLDHLLGSHSGEHGELSLGWNHHES